MTTLDYSLSYGTPAGHAEAVSPSDTVDLDQGVILYVGIPGTVKVLTIGGETVEYQNFQGFLPVRVVRVFETVDTGTIAGNFVGHWH